MYFSLKIIVLTLVFSSKIHAQMQAEERKIQIGDYTFDCRIAGNPDGEGVILLHGWPETSIMWQPLLDSLAKSDYYCLAPNMRGFSPDARPKGKKNYMLAIVAADIIGLADSLGMKKFHLIGHDWGSGVGWAVVALYPDRILSWTAMSVPHIKAFGMAIKNDKDQHKRSSYMRLFQIGCLPEAFLLAKKMKKLREEAWNLCSEAQLKNYIETFGNKKAMTATLNYYRANYRDMIKGFPDMPQLDSIQPPTLFIWGKNDSAVNEVGVKLTEKFMAGEYRLLPLDAGHWLMQEAFEPIKTAILAHLQQHRLAD